MLFSSGNQFATYLLPKPFAINSSLKQLFDNVFMKIVAKVVGFYNMNSAICKRTSLNPLPFLTLEPVIAVTWRFLIRNGLPRLQQSSTEEFVKIIAKYIVNNQNTINSRTKFRHWMWNNNQSKFDMFCFTI